MYHYQAERPLVTRRCSVHNGNGYHSLVGTDRMRGIGLIVLGVVAVVAIGGGVLLYFGSDSHSTAAPPAPKTIAFFPFKFPKFLSSLLMII